MHPLIKSILENKKAEVAFNRNMVSPEDMKKMAGDAPDTRNFIDSIHACQKNHKVIAEIKRISPGTGFCRKDFDPARIAELYERAGAAALSVLTDTVYFGGSPHCLQLAKQSASIPVLRKDFIIDAYQIYESKVIGADAVLIMAVNFDTGAVASDLCGLALELGMDVLFEIHDEGEIDLIPNMDLCVGINNRDFRSEKLKVDTGATRKLAPLLEDYRLLVSESGIRDGKAMDEFEKLGVHAFLIGSALMQEDDPGLALSSLL